MKKKIILGVAIITLLCGCGKTIPTLSDGKEAVVTFKDGSMISVDDLYKEMKDDYATSVLIEMIDKKILEEEYKDNLDEAKEYASNYIDSLKNYYKDEKGNYDENALIQAVQQYYGYASLDIFEEAVRINFLRNKAIDDYAKKQITDKEIEKYYKDEIKADRETYHIQIVPEVTDTMTDDEKKTKEEEALNEAKSVIAKLKKGENFEDLVKEYSDDEATKENGGSLGNINKGTFGSDEFDKALYELKVGEYSNTPVKTTKGYEIIYVKSEADKKSLEDVKEEIIETLGKKKASDDATTEVNALTELRKSKGIDIVDSDVNRTYNTYIDRLLEQAEASNKKKTSSN